MDHLFNMDDLMPLPLLFRLLETIFVAALFDVVAYLPSPRPVQQLGGTANKPASTKAKAHTGSSRLNGAATSFVPKQTPLENRVLNQDQPTKQPESLKRAGSLKKKGSLKRKNSKRKTSFIAGQIGPDYDCTTTPLELVKASGQVPASTGPASLWGIISNAFTGAQANADHATGSKASGPASLWGIISAPSQRNSEPDYTTGKKAFGPAPPPLPTSVTSPKVFRGGIIIEGHHPALTFARAPQYRKSRMLLYSDGSFLERSASKGNLAGAAVVYRTDPRDPWTVRAFHMRTDDFYWSIEDIEIWGMAAALETALKSPQLNLLNHVKVFCDSKLAIQEVEDTKVTSRKADKASRPGLRRLLYYASQLADAGVEVKLHWCPGHCGVPGNRIADQFAVVGRNYIPQRTNIPARPKPSEFADGTHPEVWELDLPAVPDMAGASTGIIAELPPPRQRDRLRFRPRRNSAAAQMSQSNALARTGGNSDGQLIVAGIERLVNNQIAALEKLTRDNHNALVQLTGNFDMGNFDMSVLPFNALSVPPAQSPVPIAMIEAPPETVDTTLQVVPAPTLRVNQHLGDHFRGLGISRALSSPVLSLEPESSFSSSREETRIIHDSDRNCFSSSGEESRIIHDSDHESVVSTIATSIGDDDELHVHKPAQKLEDEELGPDSPRDMLVVAVSSEYLRNRFPRFMSLHKSAHF